MPEGHTVLRIAKYQRRLLVGKKLLVSSPQGRFVDGAKLVNRKRLVSIETLGKHLFYHYEKGLTVHVHLGMHGRYRYSKLVKAKPPEPRGLVRMRLIADRFAVDLNGPTRCEVIDARAVQAIRDRIGPDVLDPEADRDLVWEKIHRSKRSIGLQLMDQSVMSGVGNAYRSEILYRQKIDPKQPGNTLTREQFEAIWEDSVALLKLGVKTGMIVTVAPEDTTKPLRSFKGPDRDRFYVYRRSTCLKCGAKTKTYEIAGRTVYVCSKEQPGD